MPKETFGGDDDEEAPQEEKKKLNLSKYSTGPDSNIKDVFWEIIISYSEGNGPGLELKSLEMDRFAIVRSAISTLSRPSPMYAKMMPRDIAKYSIMMFLDAGWEDIFVEFLEECKPRLKQFVVDAMRALAKDKEYGIKVVEYLRAMLRYRENSEIALEYIGELGERETSEFLKKELIILARGDIGANQMNAIIALSVLNDQDTIKTMISLLSHWDEGARMAAAEVLLEKRSADVITAAKQRLKVETNIEIQEILKKIASG